VSQENVELVRQGFHALRVGDIEAFLSFFPTDVVWHPFVEWPDDPVYRGYDGVRKLIAAWTDNFEDWGIEVREIRAAGTRVVALTEMTGETKGSRVPIRQPLGLYFPISTRTLCAKCTTSSRGMRPSKPSGWSGRRCRSRTWTPSSAAMSGSG
jgi:ketosteroid isomerase-like protein